MHLVKLLGVVFMNINFSRFSVCGANLLQQAIISSLTPLQKKVCLVVIALFALAAVIFACFTYKNLSKPKQREEELLDVNSSGEIGPVFIKAVIEGASQVGGAAPVREVEKEINSRIRAQLPKYVFSKEGNIGDQHLMHYLNTEKPENRDEIILWSFTQRKFQSAGSMVDTVALFPKGGVPLGDTFGLFVDKEGYAISLSDHSAHKAVFLTDEEIKHAEECVRYEVKGEKQLLVGYHADGKCIIQQPGVRSCVPTSLAMVLLDQGVDFDLGLLYTTNLANDERIAVWSEGYGYKAVSVEASEVGAWIEKNGSLLCSINAPGLGSHEIVVDAIGDTTVTIREPFHGRRVTIDRELFFEKMLPGFTGIIKE